MPVSLRADGVGKAYAPSSGPAAALRELLFRRRNADAFWAVREISLELRRGAALGVVGDNGAGKTTLLKVLAGATAPTEGCVSRHGRVAAILSLGAGFHAELTGVENARVGCAVLGLTPAETDAVLPRIFDFAELGDAAGRVVRTYSSGMYLRLAFSVAVAADPDVLIIDEHLAVGDRYFQHKCLRRLTALRDAGCTLVLCSHDVYLIGELCEQTLWLHEGRQAMVGNTTQVLHAYEDHIRRREAAPTETPSPERRPSADNCLCAVTLGGDCVDGEIDTAGRLELRIDAKLTDDAAASGASVGVVIVRNDGVWCYGTSTKIDGLSQRVHGSQSDVWSVRFIVDGVPLLAGSYSFIVALLDEPTPHTYDYWTGAAPFRVRDAAKEVGVVRIAHRWETA